MKNKRLLHEPIGKTKFVYDWNALKAEWLASDESPHEFRKRKGISHTWFWAKFRKEEWDKSKTRLHQESMQKLEKKLANGNADRWANQIKLWKAMETRAAQALNDPARSTPVDATEIATVVEKSLKAQKLILGEDTGEGGVLNQNFYLGIAQLVSQGKQARKIEIASCETVEPGNPISESTQVDVLPANSNKNGQIEEL